MATTPNYNATTGDAGAVTATISGTVAVTQSGTWTVQQGTPPWSVGGNAASGASDSGNPVKTGGVYNTALPTLTNGQRGNFQVDSSSRLIVAPLANTSIVKAQLQDNAGTAVVLGQTTMSASLPVTLASNQSALSVAQSGVWNVGGVTAVNSQALTVTSSQAYTTGQCIGGLITMSSALRAIGTGLIQKVVVNMKSLQTAPLDLLIFNANPSSSTLTDTNAIVISTTDIAAWVGTIHLTDVTAGGASNVRTQWQASNLADPIVLPSGTTVYAAIVARGSVTTGTTELCQIITKFLQD